MIGRVGSWAIRIALLILILFTLAVLLVVFVLNTESGSHWAITRADSALPGALNVASFEGTLWAGMQIDTLTYADSGQRIEIKELDVDLDWPSILAGRVALNSIYARSLTRTSLRPSAEEPEPFNLSMQPLPIPIRIAAGSVRDLVLVNDANEQRLTDLAFEKLQIDGQTIAFSRAQGNTDAIFVDLGNFSTTLANRTPTAGAVGWISSDGEWSGNGVVEGDLTALKFQQQVRGLYPANISGTFKILDQIEPVFDANVVSSFALEGAAYELVGTATGNLRELAAFSARIRGEVGELNLSGQMTRLPEFSATATAVASGVNPALIRGDVQGDIDATADLSLDADGLLTISELFVSGQLNDAPLRARGQLLVSSNLLQCSRCVFDIGTNRISIDGSNADNGLSLSISVNAPALSELWPGLAGTAVGKGAIEGAASNPRTTGDMTFSNLVFNDAEYGNLQLSWQGSITDAELAANWRFEDVTASSNASILFGDDQITGTIHSATVSKENLGDWVLQQPFPFRAAQRHAHLGSNEWRGKLGDVRIAQFGLTDDSFGLVAAIRDIPLEIGNQLFPQNVQISGSGSADIDITRENDVWEGTLSWTQADTRLQVEDENGEVTDVVIRRADASARLANGGVVANATIAIDPGVTADVSLELDQLAGDAQMTGNLQLQGDDWSWISAVVTQIDRFDGSIAAAVTAQGPFRDPMFSGTAEWKNGRILIPASNVLLDEISMIITGAPGGDASIVGSAKAGNGTLQLTGRLNDLMQATRSAQFAITGDNATLVNWPDYQFLGSPDIKLSGSGDEWHINGQLEVPRAYIAPRAVPVSAVTISPDVVVLGEDYEVPPQTRITGETRLILGKRVQFEALGLDTRLAGAILFKQQDGRPIRAEGRLELIDGTYTAQGRKLKIEQGELIFNGPLDDPMVDVRAVRVIETLDGNVTAGIHLRGRAQSLTTTVFSEPAMADADALSYLVIGRPLSQATDRDGSELSGAAIALGLRQATRITEQIGQTLGLDQLSLAGDGGDTTALVAGKQINSRLHARYAYGVFSRLGTLLLRYRLSRRLTLEAGTGENQSIDVLYTIEK